MSQSNDPRASLAAYGQSQAAESYPAQYARFYATPPSVSDDQVEIWYARGQNFVVGHVVAKAGAVIQRSDQVDEYAILALDPNVSFVVTWEGVQTQVVGGSIAFVPAGSSSIRLEGGGSLTLMMTTRNQDVSDLCENFEAYKTQHANIPRFEEWPQPPTGLKVRQYSLDVAHEPGRFGRIWRCSTFMINVLPAQIGPRDTAKLSPHHHDDFEQGSLALEGSFTHHVRWPWNSDLSTWRADDHEFCASPSLAVIPPPAIHTSRGMDEGTNQLIDIFSPPRVDFSLKEGWVLNADEYPLPAKITPV